MVGTAHLKPAISSVSSRSPAASALYAATGLVGALFTVAVLSVGVVVAVVFAATLAFVMVLASVLLGLAAVAWRVRRPMRGVAAVSLGAGHAWVAYDWKRRAH